MTIDIILEFIFMSSSIIKYMVYIELEIRSFVHLYHYQLRVFNAIKVTNHILQGL